MQELWVDFYTHKCDKCDQMLNKRYIKIVNIIMKIPSMSWEKHWEFEGQEEVKMTKENVEDATGEGEQGYWFGEGECLESGEMESWSWRDCC